MWELSTHYLWWILALLLIAEGDEQRLAMLGECNAGQALGKIFDIVAGAFKGAFAQPGIDGGVQAEQEVLREFAIGGGDGEGDDGGFRALIDRQIGVDPCLQACGIGR